MIEWTTSIDMILVLAILVLTIILFISNAIRVDVVAVLVLAALGISQILPPEQLFSGFSSEAVISLIAIMIISSGLENVGISVKIARWVLKFGKEHPNRILLVIMFLTGLLASFMRSLGTVALFLPIVSRIHARTGLAKSFLLMPIAFCAILGGTLTMVGTAPLIILNSLLKNSYQYGELRHMPNYAPFNMFDVFPVGVLLLTIGIIYLFLVKSKISSDKATLHSFSSGTTKNHFKKTYNKDCDLFEIRVLTSCPLIGLPVKDFESKLASNVSLLALSQGKETHLPPLKGTAIKSNAVLALMGNREVIETLCSTYDLKLLPRLTVFSESLHPVRAGLCEAVIPPSSQLLGLEVRELHMKRNHKVHVLALCRAGTIFQGDELSTLTLRPGDTLGMFSRWEALDALQQHPDFFVLTTSYPKEKIYPKKMPQAIFFFLLSITLLLYGGFPTSVGLLLGAVGMIATGVLSIDQAYQKVSWKTVFLLAGLLPLGLAMQTTGTAEWLTQLAIPNNLQVPNQVILLCISVLTTILALVISNIGATVLMVPIAMNIAFNLGADPRLYALAVALSASNTFLLPTHQVNALIAGPGNYTVKDFIKIGGWITVMFWLIILISIELFFKH